jgi:hypothetical protein
MTYKINTTDFLKPGRLLPQVVQGSPVERFSGQDSYDRFVKNLKTQPLDWKYRNKEVSYLLNQQSYRAPEWNTIDWKNSAVILGCSNVFGVGLAEDETISHQLSLLLNRPVINLGVGSSGMLFAMHNSVLLNKNFPTPWAVINIWSDPFRIHEFVSATYIKHYTATGSFDTNQAFRRAWGDSEINPELHSYFACKATESIWSSKTKYLSYSHWISLDIESIKSLSLPKYDFARDLCHPGSEMAIATARIIYNDLQ